MYHEVLSPHLCRIGNSIIDGMVAIKTVKYITILPPLLEGKTSDSNTTNTAGRELPKNSILWLESPFDCGCYLRPLCAKA